MLVQYCLAVFLLLNISHAQPVPDSTTEALVVVSSEAPQTKDEAKKEPIPPQLKSMHVISNVRNRYARTVVTSKYANPELSAQQATFSIVLPDTAFIAGFVMEIEGKKYEAYVREKEAAKKEYEQAVAQGLGAAHVAVSARDSNKFTVSVNVEPQSKVIFNLTYEELLVRKHGKYEMVINLHPGQLIKDLGVDVNINETRPIINVETPALRSGNEITNEITRNEYATINNSDGIIHISFHPTVEQQKTMAKALKAESNTTQGISGQFVIEYDVERDPSGGEVLVDDGYFVHFFAPSELKPIPKHIVFVLDVSGSMYGRKIEQLKQAMKVILEELNPDDYFHLVKFHSTVHVLNSNNSWEYITNPAESELFQGIEATAENIKNAQNIVEQMSDEGATNIYDALLVGLRLSSKGVPNLKESENGHKPQPIIVFLTDGQANMGESNPKKMIEMVQDRNVQETKTAIFALAFGDDADNEFLKELGIKNSGFSRKIYEAADASLQLQDFYKQISSPLLTNVNFKYTEEQVKNVTKHNFDIMFKGSEFVVAGKLEKETDKFVTVEGSTLEGLHNFHPIICTLPPTPPKPTEEPKEFGSLERLWAYLTIKQLLDKKYENKASDNDTSSEDTPKKQALKLALKYSFVTPVTSLVVVKPNDTESTAAAEEAVARPQYGGYHPGSGAFYNSYSAGVPMAMPQSLHSVPQFSYHAMPGQRFDDVDSDSIPAEAETETETEDVPSWMQSMISPAGQITIDNKVYEIGSNATSVKQKTCNVDSLKISGRCTLLSACPKMYPTLDTFETYKTYFCSLDSDRYAGICCPEDPTLSKFLPRIG